jgi:hypothetical protein
MARWSGLIAMIRTAGFPLIPTAAAAAAAAAAATTGERQIC